MFWSRCGPARQGWLRFPGRFALVNATGLVTSNELVEVRTLDRFLLQRKMQETGTEEGEHEYLTTVSL